MALICISGGSGFFGSSLARALVSRGDAVRILDLEEPCAELLPFVDFRRIDIRDSEGTKEALAGCEQVFHIAAAVPVSRIGRGFYEINVVGTKNILEGARERSVKHFIHFSTSQSLYGHSPVLPVDESTPQQPFGDYGRSKAEAEALVRSYRDNGLCASIVRPRTIIGAGRLGIFHILFERIKRGKIIPIPGGGSNRIQFVGLDDLVGFSILLMEKRLGGDFNVGASEFGSLKDDLKKLVEHAGSASKVLSLPVSLSVSSGCLMEKLGISPFVDLHYHGIHKDFYFDLRKARDSLGFQPKQSNLDALKEAYDWYVNNRESVVVSRGTTHTKGLKDGFLKFIP